MDMPLQHTISVNGVDLVYFEWGEPGQTGLTILLVHATGFHARCWDQVVKHLPGLRVIALDMRGHGRSSKIPPYKWDTFGADLTGFIRELDLQHVVGAGHSMGGHSLVQAMAAEQSRFNATVLVDPVILAPEVYGSAAGSIDAESHPVARRRNAYASPEEMMESLGNRGNFGVWQREVFEDYCRHGLLPNESGDGYVLACPPIVEATIYSGSAGTNIYDAIRSITVPVTILRATPRDATRLAMDFSMSPTNPDLVNYFSNATDVFLPELTHFIPMQAPELVARHILKYAAPETKS